MADYEIYNAKIIEAKISIDLDRDWLNIDLLVKYDGYCQAFSLVAHNPNFKGKKCYRIENVAGHIIWRIMEIAEVFDWSELKGKKIRIKKEDGFIRSIGHIIKNDWFCPRKDFKDKAIGGEV